MAKKVEQSSSVEPQSVQTAVSMSSSSAALASSPKVSMFGAKSGFVIPKNKLSGSLVPIFRGSGKVDASDVAKEEGRKQVQRKTKWGIDLALDASVRRGRALAYQTRVEQITKQLKSGALEIGEDQNLQSSTQVPDQGSSSQIDKLGKREFLELEKREAIGEILQLNPSYKASADYKPLLKEATVPIPIKAYHGYNFISLILGPESNTQKRLEEETGAKIRVHGTKVDTGEKKEITLSDGDEAQATYKELYVHISADTFEKIDVAVALIELLVTPVSGSSVAVTKASTSGPVDHVNVIGQGQGSAVSYMMPMAAVNQGLVQPLGSVPSGPPLVHFQQYPGPWFPHCPPNTPFRSPYGFIAPPNSAPMLNNSIRFLPSPNNPFNTSPLFGVRPPTLASFGSLPRNPSFILGPQPPMQVLQRPYIPETRPSNQNTLHQNHPMPGQHPQPTYLAVPARSSSSVPAPFTANQPMPTGLTSAVRPPVMPSMQQPVSAAPSGLPPNQQSTSMHAAGNLSGWSGAPPNIPPPLRSSSNMMQMVPPSVPSHSSLPTAPKSVIPSSTQSGMPGTIVSRPLAANAIPPSNFLSQPTKLFTTPPVNHLAPAPAPAFASGPHVGAPPTPTLSSLSMSVPPMISNSIATASVALLGPSPHSSSPAPPPVSSQAPALVNASSASVLGQAPSPMQSSSSAAMQPILVRPISSSSPGQASAPVMMPVQSASQPPLLPAPSSVSGSAPSFSPLKTPMTSLAGIQPVPAPKPQRPSSSDFTFQPQRPQLPASPNIPRPTSQAVAQNTPMPSTPSIQLPSAPQTQSFRPAMNNSAPPTGIAGFPRLPAANQRGQQPQASMPPPSPNSVTSFGGNQRIIHPAPRLPSFQNPRSGPTTTPTSQVGRTSFSSGRPQAPNLRGPLPIHPGNQLPPTNRSGSLIVPNQQLGYVAGRPTLSPSGGNQIYDPFSPTSISSAPQQQQQGGRPARKQETDAEYEDLMASVGVR